MKQILNDVMIIKLTLWVATFGIGFNGAENNCKLAHILAPPPPPGGVLGILLMNSYDF